MKKAKHKRMMDGGMAQMGRRVSPVASIGRGRPIMTRPGMPVGAPMPIRKAMRGGGLARKGVGMALRGGGLARKGVGMALAKGGLAKRAGGCAKRGVGRGKMV
jgi:hypothetical protein